MKPKEQWPLASLVAEKEVESDLCYVPSLGVMAWMARASTNLENMASWKIIVGTKCPLCSVVPCILGNLLSLALDR